MKPQPEHLYVNNRVDDDLYHGRDVASEFHSGQFSALYALGCARWEYLKIATVHRALRELREDFDRYQGNWLVLTRYNCQQAIERLAAWCERNPIPEDDDDDY